MTQRMAKRKINPSIRPSIIGSGSVGKPVVLVVEGPDVVVVVVVVEVVEVVVPPLLCSTT